MLLDNFQNKTVVLTGHTGFKGAWLTAWLKQLGAKVVGISLDPPTTPSHFIAASLPDGMVDLRIDIRNREALEEAIVSAKPDFVFHLAAQALVRHSYENPLETWQTNVLGTRHSIASPDWLPKAEVEKIEWNDDAALERSCDGIDVIIHAAGIKHE